ncbi:hypothetical protein ES703_110989 [subsurface metagenome]
MKRQILISLLILLSVAGFSGAVNPPGINLPDLGYYNLSEDDLTAYKEGELLVRFAEVEAGAQLPEGPVLMGPLTNQAIRNSISDYIFTGAACTCGACSFCRGGSRSPIAGGSSKTDGAVDNSGHKEFDFGLYLYRGSSR